VKETVLLAWWFFYVAGTSSGIAGPFPTAQGCDFVRGHFHRFLRGVMTSECVGDS
jgi:hypothetical protein